MLETFTLKQHLDTTRQELSQALYQHDAACRVIARLMKERDEVRAALSTLQASGIAPVSINGNSATREGAAAVADSGRMEVDSEATESTSGVSSAVVARINETCAELSTGRKTRKPAPEGPFSRESIASVSHLKSSYTPHTSTKGAIHSLALSPVDGQFILTGGVDKDVLLSERTTGKVCARMSGHTKKINSVAFHPHASSSLKFSASADKSIKIWSLPTAQVEGAAKTTDEHSSLEGHTSEVSSISVHPSGKISIS
jgi:pre-mRNA-processing factor 19